MPIHTQNAKIYTAGSTFTLYLKDVNLCAAAPSDTLIIAGSSGQRLAVENITGILKSISGAGVVAQISAGTNAGTYNNFMAAQNFTPTSTGGFWSYRPATGAYSSISTNAAYFRVSTASTYTTAVADFYITLRILNNF